MKKNISIFLISLGAFILNTLFIMKYSGSRIIDYNILSYIQGFLSFYPTTLAEFVSNFGGQYCLFWPQLVGVTTLFSHKKYMHGILLVIFTQISWHGNDLIKLYIKRERPCGDVYPGYSYPSCHSSVTVCFYGIIIYLIARYVKNKFLRYILIGIIGCYIIAVLLSRMILNVHFPFDIIGGALIGTMLINLYIICTKNEN